MFLLIETKLHRFSKFVFIVIVNKCAAATIPIIFRQHKSQSHYMARYMTQLVRYSLFLGGKDKFLFRHLPKNHKAWLFGTYQISQAAAAPKK